MLAKEILKEKKIDNLEYIRVFSNFSEGEQFIEIYDGLDKLIEYYLDALDERIIGYDGSYSEDDIDEYFVKDNLNFNEGEFGEVLYVRRRIKGKLVVEEIESLKEWIKKNK